LKKILERKSFWGKQQFITTKLWSTTINN